MRILLDTNIIIHREASNIANQDIGQLFFWIEKLNYIKYVHPLTVTELEKHLDITTVKSMGIKLSSYNILQTLAPISPEVQSIIDHEDITENDKNDSKILNELLNKRVDTLITEDKKIYKKASKLNIDDKIFSIDSFLEFVLAENPSLLDYKTLSVQKELFGRINLKDEFFDSFRKDYVDFDEWFIKKSEEIAYVCYFESGIRAFLYIKKEDINEPYSNITPIFKPKKRLKVGTLKITLNGVKLGERFLKIVFDNALVNKVDEIYVTIFENRPEQIRLVNLFNDFGFTKHGEKVTKSGTETVLVRNFSNSIVGVNPKENYPYLTKNKDIFFIAIYPEYHTELFPDSILNNESPADFVENEPHRNAICKSYVSHAYFKDLNENDIIIFYRTGGRYKGVMTTIGVVESVNKDIKDLDNLIQICRKRSVLTESQLKEMWNKFGSLKPFVINFLYSYSLPNRPNLNKLVEIKLIPDNFKIPRGIWKISWDKFIEILKISNSNENIISN